MEFVFMHIYLKIDITIQVWKHKFGNQAILFLWTFAVFFLKLRDFATFANNFVLPRHLFFALSYFKTAFMQTLPPFYFPDRYLSWVFTTSNQHEVVQTEQHDNKFFSAAFLLAAAAKSGSSCNFSPSEFHHE